MSTEQDLMREAFEDWAESKGFSIDRCSYPYMFMNGVRRDKGDYIDGESDRAWHAWQAARQQSVEQEPVAVVKDHLTAKPAAYAAFAENGNIQIWCADPSQAETLRQKYGHDLKPLYTAPQPSPAPADITEAEKWCADNESTPREFLAHGLLVKRSDLLGRKLTWSETLEVLVSMGCMTKEEQSEMLAMDDPAPAAPDVAALVRALERAIESMYAVDGENDCSKAIDAAETALSAHRQQEQKS